MYEAQDLGSGREYALKVIKGTKVLWVFLCFVSSLEILLMT